MSPKEYMAEADRLRRRIKRKENEIRTLRASAEGMMGAGNNDMPKSDSKNLHKMESAVCKIIALQEEVSEIQKELDALVGTIRSQILSIHDNDARDMLSKRYIEFKPWKEIFIEMGYSKSSAFRLHQEFIDEIKFGTSWDIAGLAETSKV